MADAGSLPATEESPGWWARLLRTPLLTKLVLLDLVVNVLTFAGLQAAPLEWVEELTFLSLAVVLVLNAGLVAVALRPLAALEQTARRVSAGEYTARTRMPPLTDRNLARIGATFDTLLDRVQAERSRVRALATELVAAGDRERAHIARELHDGTAQSLSALDMLLVTTLADAPEGPVRSRLESMREIVSEALREVRALSQAVHPRVLDDLGLPAALQHLARRTNQQFPVEVALEVVGDRPIPAACGSVLYRVAQEAIHNAVKHAKVEQIRVRLSLADDRAELWIEDLGVGFDRGGPATDHGGMGLFVMEERVSLLDGRLTIDSRPGQGTTIHAVLPLPPEGEEP